MVLQAERIINGSYGKLFDGTEYLAQVRNIQARIGANRQDLVPVGDAWTRYKKMAYIGDGSFTLWKATSRYLQLMVNAVALNTIPTLFLDVTLADPESLGTEEVRLQAVKIWEVPIGFESGELIEETIQFTFEGVKLTTAITGNVSTTP